MRRILLGIGVVGLVVVGLVTQAGGYLLALPSPGSGTPTTGAQGPYAVGIERVAAPDAPIDLTIWYPARETEDPHQVTYSYGLKLFGPDSSMVLATFPGHARPAAPADTTGGPHPLVVLSPGFAISASSYGWLAEHLASLGFVVVAPDHAETLDPRALWKAAVERPSDVIDVLAYVDSQVERGWLGGLVDADAVAVVGHSYGGYTALAAGGARIHPDALVDICGPAEAAGDPITFLCDALTGRIDDMAALSGLEGAPMGMWPAVSDPRVDAVVSISGDAAMFGPSGLAGITVPMLAIGGTADHDSPFEWTTQLAFDSASSDRKVQISFEGAGHMVFAGGCDRPRRVLSLVPIGLCSDGVWDRDDLHAIVQEDVATFLMAELLGDPAAASALADPRSGHDGVTIRSEGY